MRRFFGYVALVVASLAIGSCQPVQLPKISRVRIHSGAMNKSTYDEIKPLVPEKYQERLARLRWNNFTVHYTVNNTTQDETIEIQDLTGTMVIKDAADDGLYLRFFGAALPNSVTVDGKEVPPEDLEGMTKLPGWKRCVAGNHLRRHRR